MTYDDIVYASERFPAREKIKFVVCLCYFLYVLALCGWHWDAQAVVAERVGNLFVAMCLMPNVTGSVALVSVDRLRERVRKLEQSAAARPPPDRDDAN